MKKKRIFLVQVSVRCICNNFVIRINNFSICFYLLFRQINTIHLELNCLFLYRIVLYCVVLYWIIVTVYVFFCLSLFEHLFFVKIRSNWNLPSNCDEFIVFFSFLIFYIEYGMKMPTYKNLSLTKYYGDYRNCNKNHIYFHN